ncbi:aldehyde dehydrogenase NAD(P)-dependent [Kipferlia bialata]|uniref:Aldehyde dehydrogenase n=1 Tax=Kipferlia bialata TaxID=797122 RepID=A0A9K3CM31_9EUKA|nr:aldehyde dehydrogenase NAD(P)-dependent [Kipferlia bialata]|eukprot:g291.t1
MPVLSYQRKWSEFEATNSEYVLILEEIQFNIDNVKRHNKPKSVPAPAVALPGRAFRQAEAKGPVLVISPFNFPMNLALVPFAAAIACGNPAVLRPSSSTPHCAAYMQTLITRCLDPTLYRCIRCSHSVADSLLAKSWGHIFFTGSVNVGRHIARLAAETLTPVTLELGGQSPTIVTDTANIATAAQRVALGKAFNAGQVCVAPNHAIVCASVYDEFVSKLKAAFTSFYGKDAQASPHFGRIVSDREWRRLNTLVEAEREAGTTVTQFGSPCLDDRFYPPTILEGCTLTGPCMQNELFGPVLPVFKVPNVQQALAFLESQPWCQADVNAKPLALYLFSTSKKEHRMFIRHTSSGGVTINDTMIHVFSAELPFGGVGTSGMGTYHHHASLDTFSHHKPVLQRHSPNTPVDTLLRQPPHKLAPVTFKHPSLATLSSSAVWTGLGVVAGIAVGAGLVLALT